jgi:DNA modification methylase
MADQPRLIKDETATAQVDEVQKAEYRERLRQKLQDPAFRQIEGFPIGEDEDILALSDPPYYTACPNPFLPEIVEQWQAERAEIRQKLGLPVDEPKNGYHREPFAADVSEGKNDPIYNAHSYHTKVPHKAIMRYILHYTDPGDIVFDGFCGTGMTGVAAQLCGDRKEVESLGYRVDRSGVVYDGEQAISRLGSRKAVLNDLSPAATFIAYNYNAPVDISAVERIAGRILDNLEEELGWMYETWHPHCKAPQRVKGRIKYTIWSDVFVCPQCSAELVFWQVAIDSENGKVRDRFECNTCRALLTKRELERSTEMLVDTESQQSVKIAKQVPVLIIYDVGSGRFTKQPDEDDLLLVEASKVEPVTGFYPVARIDRDIDLWYERDYRSLGVYSVDGFFTRRNLKAMSALWKSCESEPNRLLLFSVTGILRDSSRLTGVDVRKFFKGGGGPFAGGVKGTLYIPSLVVEKNVFFAFRNRIKRVALAFSRPTRPYRAVVTTQSLGRMLNIPADAVDYIFVDPPFGENIIYSDLSILWETWLRISTQTEHEAVIHRRKKSNANDLQQYALMMARCFKEVYRILKPGHWLTVEFHNTRNSVWNAIQEAILKSGFMVADVRTLDKRQGTFKQINTSNAVKQDLIISAYKPHTGFEQRFIKDAGSEAAVWDFVRQHLAQLPVAIEKNGVLETLGERQDYLLFDRMVAFHIQRGATVPLSANEFYAGLWERFIERDGMFFLSEQVPEYDKARLQAQEVAQLSLFVSDEKSSIQWLRQQLTPDLGGHAQTYQEIQPKFLRQLHQSRHEALPELSDMLEENFLQDEHGRWYAPNPNKASDLEKLRRKSLLREFNEYLTGNKKLKQFRTEAIRAGFAHAWQNREYRTIVQVAERLPETVLQEDPDLLMYYDNASLMT